MNIKTQKLTNYLNTLEKQVSKQHLFNDKVSKSNVGWHIEHTLLSINLIFESTKNSNPDNFRFRFKIPRLAVFMLKKIPRGRAKAPEVVVPKRFDEKTLQSHVEEARMNLIQFEHMNPNKYFSHPFFGDMKLIKTINFIEIHTKHHLEIINDIVKQNS